MDEISIALEEASEASSITAVVVMNRIEENRLANRKLLENFMGVRPMRRHASMRPAYISLNRVKTIDEEETSLAKKWKPEKRDEDDGAYQGLANRYDDWSFSVLEADDAPAEEQPSELQSKDQSLTVVPKATETKRSCLRSPRPKRSSIEKASSQRQASKGRMSSFACVTRIVGGQSEQRHEDHDNDGCHNEEEEEERDELSEGSSVSSHESRNQIKHAKARRDDEWDTQITVPRVDLFSLWNNYVRSTASASKRVETGKIQCIGPCGPVSFDSYDSYAFELSDGSSIKDENSSHF